jgi:hypothetical protein
MNRKRYRIVPSECSNVCARTSIRRCPYARIGSCSRDTQSTLPPLQASTDRESISRIAGESEYISVAILKKSAQATLANRIWGFGSKVWLLHAYAESQLHLRYTQFELPVLSRRTYAVPIGCVRTYTTTLSSLMNLSMHVKAPVKEVESTMFWNWNRVCVYSQGTHFCSSKDFSGLLGPRLRTNLCDSRQGYHIRRETTPDGSNEA